MTTPPDLDNPFFARFLRTVPGSSSHGPSAPVALASVDVGSD
jgi:hypothetical protein